MPWHCLLRNCTLWCNSSCDAPCSVRASRRRRQQHQSWFAAVWSSGEPPQARPSPVPRRKREQKFLFNLRPHDGDPRWIPLESRHHCVGENGARSPELGRELEPAGAGWSKKRRPSESIGVHQCSGAFRASQLPVVSSRLDSLTRSRQPWRPDTCICLSAGPGRRLEDLNGGVRQTSTLFMAAAQSGLAHSASPDGPANFRSSGCPRPRQANAQQGSLGASAATVVRL